MDKRVSYLDVLQYLMPKYNRIQTASQSKNKFVSRSKINIVGIIEYVPHNTAAVIKFYKFINK